MLNYGKMCTHLPSTIEPLRREKRANALTGSTYGQRDRHSGKRCFHNAAASFCASARVSGLSIPSLGDIKSIKCNENLFTDGKSACYIAYVYTPRSRRRVKASAPAKNTAHTAFVCRASIATDTIYIKVALLR